MINEYTRFIYNNMITLRFQGILVPIRERFHGAAFDYFFSGLDFNDGKNSSPHAGMNGIDYSLFQLHCLIYYPS